MTSTNLKKDAFCYYNQSAAPFYWVFEPGQYTNNYVYGEVGIFSSGGSAGTYVRPDVIDIDSLLSGRDDILSKCNPPIPNIDETTRPPMTQQNDFDVSLLISKDTREKKSAVDLAEVDYNRWEPNLPVEAQNLRFVIEDFSAQRGGLDTQNFSKSAWQPTVARGSAVNGDKNYCLETLSPSRYCGDFCGPINGTNMKAREIEIKPLDNYPFGGVMSQDVKNVGATECGENQFYGRNYTEGSCGAPPKQRMFVNRD